VGGLYAGVGASITSLEQTLAEDKNMKSTGDTVTQAFQCGGTWGSELDGRDDGQFVNLVVNGSGNLSGRHKPATGSEKNIKGGKCEQPDGGEKQRISIQREDDENEYHYSGYITDLGGNRFRADGKCRTTRKRRDGDEEDAEGSRARPPQTDEDWVASRPPNV
jgi:hypothetical protein